MPTPIRTTPPGPRRTALAWAVRIAAVAAVTALPVPAEAQLTPLSITAVDPGGGLPGDPVAISGTGFGSSPESLLCWVDSGDGGFSFEVEAAANGGIDAVVGNSPSAATGAVKVWRGKRYPLADRVVLTQSRFFAASDGEVFVRQDAAVGPDFSSFGGSPGTFGSVTAQEELRLDLKDVDPDGSGGGPQRVRVVAVIETNEDSDNNANTNGNLTLRSSQLSARTARAAGPAWAATSTIETDAAPSTPAALAAGLAEVLEAQLGSLGLTARAEGTELVLGHAQGIRAGFVHLTERVNSEEE